MKRLNIAVKALRTCAELGSNILVDIAVVRRGDIMFASKLSPTTPTVPRYDIGTRSARILLDSICGRSGKREVVLIVRQSVP